MALKNTTEHYGAIARWLHWTTAVLFLGAYCSIYYREWVAESELENWRAIQLHLSIGISLGVLVVLRIFWRITNRPPTSVHGARLERIAKQTAHCALYVIMVVMPITGYLSIAEYLSSGRGGITYFLLIDLEMFKDVEFIKIFGVTFEQLEKPAKLIHHYLGAWFSWLLILGHISAALYHHIIRKDNTLRKMMFSH